MVDWNKIPTQKIQAIVDRSGDAATVAWAHEGQGNLAALADPMLGIAAAAALGNVAILQKVVAPKELKKAAGAALHRLRSAGVKVAAPAAAAHFVMAADTSFLPSRAFIGVPDRMGDIELILSVTDAEGSCMLGMLVGGEDGISDIRHSHVSRNELRETWKQLEKNQLAEIPFTTGLNLADQLLSPRNDGNWRHFLEYVSAGTLASARLLDPLAKLPAEVEEDPEKIGKDWALPVRMWDATLLKKAVAQQKTGLLEASFGAISSEQGKEDEQYNAVIRSICEQMLEPKKLPLWKQYIEMVELAFRLNGRVGSADRAAGYLRAVEAGQPLITLPPVVNSVKVALYQEALALLQSDYGGSADGIYNEEE
jgi:hypothetical protein